jgi:hypothetical protein
MLDTSNRILVLLIAFVSEAGMCARARKGAVRFYSKQKWEGIVFPPVKHPPDRTLELEPSSQPEGERQMETRRQINDRRLQEIRIVCLKI